MDTEINKFTQISSIYSRFSEKNKNNLIKTAESLLKIQHTSKAMVTSQMQATAQDCANGKRRKKIGNKYF